MPDIQLGSSRLQYPHWQPIAVVRALARAFLILQHVAVGHSMQIMVRPRRRWVPTPLNFRGGESRISANTDHHWVDLVVCCGPLGYEAKALDWYMKSFALKKQLPEEPWFALGGSIGPIPEVAFVIGNERQGSTTSEGSYSYSPTMLKAGNGTISGRSR